ncbi:arpin-like [Saccoglossus kowalevskii]|uniref:Arpin n=1 Tax=Saccoglossus kowalevskii TaxID=10224 RepID=A0ABM0H0Z5_SACKO|nr:PREDICTED: arpin-like [Saccoglossus kowalevskii]
MSRFYDDRPLQPVPVINQTWSGRWTQEDWQSGIGILIEGNIRARSRHIITDSSKTKHRYYVLHMKVHHAHKRKFDSGGNEIEPNFSEKHKVSTGYLQSSYKVEAKGQSDRLSQPELNSLVTKPELIKLTEHQCPPGCVSVWIEEKSLEKIELGDGDHIRVKTSGDGPFIASFAKIDFVNVNVCNYAGGEAAGGSWTDKIMAVKAEQETKDEEDGAGADDNEWDD